MHVSKDLEYNVGSNKTPTDILEKYNISSSKGIEFAEFVRVSEELFASTQPSEDADALDAFVAMGGQPDKTGFVDVDKVAKTLSVFGLRVDCFQVFFICPLSLYLFVFYLIIDVLGLGSSSG